VVNTFRAKTPEIAEKHKDLFKYKVQDAGDGVQSMVGSICANEYVDVATTAWPAGAHPRNTLVLGMSRSITPSGVFESRDQWRNLEPFGNITGVSFNFEGEPVHYVVQQCADGSQLPEIRVILASDVVLIEDENAGQKKTEYQRIVSTLSATHFTEGSPVRNDLDPAAASEVSPEPAAVLKSTTPQKKNSPSKESALLVKDTQNAMLTFNHRASTASSGVPSSTSGQTPSSQHALATRSLSTSSVRLEVGAQVDNGEAEADDVYLQMGIDVEARWISEDIGYGIFTLRELPSDTLVTTYDGPRVDCRTGEVLFECPWTHSIEKKYTAEKKFNRSKKWGHYEREHCVLLEHSNDVCIDGTFSSQPFLFKEGFHGSTGFGASFNSGSSQFVNLKKFYKRSSSFPYDPAGITHQVRMCMWSLLLLK
jgi:hypothetical protein